MTLEQLKELQDDYKNLKEALKKSINLVDKKKVNRFYIDACSLDFHLFIYLFCDSNLWGEPSLYHYDFIKRVDEISRQTSRKNNMLKRAIKTKLNYISHRGSAKTTLTIAYIVYQVLYKREKFIVLGSNDDNKAIETLKNVLNLLNDPLIQTVYKPNITASNTKELIVNDIKIIPRSIRQNWRGINFRQVRPTLILLDDIQSEEMSYSASERESGWKTFVESIEPCVPSEEYPIQPTIILINTALHPDSLCT